MAEVSRSIEYWDEVQDDQFWIRDAADRAIAALLRGKNLLESDEVSLNIKIDRERGVVTVSDEEV